MLLENGVKEELSKAYLRAVAAVARFAMQEPKRDWVSVDATIQTDDYLAENSSLQVTEIGIQLKATVSMQQDESCLLFDLPIKNYNDLRRRRLMPTILVVLFLPAESALWISHALDALTMHGCAFWLNLRNEPAVTNMTTVRVRIPKQNVLSPDALRKIMTKVSITEEAPHAL